MQKRIVTLTTMYVALILCMKRDDTLRQMDLWRETDPELAEILNDLELHLR